MENERQQEVVRLAQHIPLNLEADDVIVYGEKRLKEWSSKEVKHMFRGNRGNLGYKNLIWFKNCVPRFSFITWIAALNKLPTADRLRGWGLQVMELCILCKNQNESRNHLFFECVYASTVWREGIRRNCTCLSTLKWEEITDYLKKTEGQGTMRRWMMKVFWTMSIYRLWTERNRKRHGEEEETPEQILRRISVDMRHRCLTLKGWVDDDINRQIVSNWGLTPNFA